LFDDDELAIIHDILPRKSLLKREASGKKNMKSTKTKVALSAPF